MRPATGVLVQPAEKYPHNLIRIIPAKGVETQLRALFAR